MADLSVWGRIQLKIQSLHWQSLPAAAARATTSSVIVQNFEIFFYLGVDHIKIHHDTKQ